jgi:hypothetical protein
MDSFSILSVDRINRIFRINLPHFSLENAKQKIQLILLVGSKQQRRLVNHV